MERKPCNIITSGCTIFYLFFVLREQGWKQLAHYLSEIIIEQYELLLLMQMFIYIMQRLRVIKNKFMKDCKGQILDRYWRGKRGGTWKRAEPEEERKRKGRRRKSEEEKEEERGG